VSQVQVCLIVLAVAGLAVLAPLGSAPVVVEAAVQKDLLLLVSVQREQHLLAQQRD
jgi:hypothetical protein